MPGSRGLLATGMIAIAVIGLLLPRLVARLALALRIERGIQAKRRATRTDPSRNGDYHAALRPQERADALDDATWDDLNMPDIFAAIDRTRSQFGRQYLFHMLRTPRSTAEPLMRLERVIGAMVRDRDAASEVRAALDELDDPRAAFIVGLLFGGLPERPRVWWVFPFLTVASLACLAVLPLWPQVVGIWLGICAMNVGVQLYYRPRVGSFVAAFHQMPAFLKVARRLKALRLPECADETGTFGRAERELATLRQASRWLLFEPGQTNELAAMLYEYVNLLFLLDVNAFVFCTQAVAGSQALLRSIFAAIGYIDAAQSIAAWRETLPYWTTPMFTPPQKSLGADRMYHPLVPGAVANAIRVRDSSVLITGSNMAGKTTFIRTVGVAAVLAQALDTVCASHWTAPFLHVRSSIGRTDSLSGGKSHYLAEVESVRSLIRATGEGRQHLFLLDELFSGTNTTERVAAGYAVLSHLNRELDIVFVATHDVELLDLLGGDYAAHHFREEIVDGALTFDFLLRPGRASTRNAIALLRVMGFPDAVVSAALAATERAPRG